VFVDVSDHRHDFSDEPSDPVVQQRVGAGRAVRIVAPAAEDRDQGVEREQR